MTTLARYCVSLVAKPEPPHVGEGEERNIIVDADCEETARVCATYCVLYNGWKVHTIHGVFRVH